MMSPAIENNLSDDVLVAGMQSVFLASTAILGNLDCYCFHQTKGLVSMSVDSSSR